MKNNLADKVKYALKNQNVVALTTSVSQVSDSAPSSVVGAYIHPNNRIIVDFTFGQDTDEIYVTPPFKMKVVDITVKCKATIATGGIIIKKGTTVMQTELACAAIGAITRATNISENVATLDVTDVLNIVGVSSGLEGMVMFDIIQA